MNDEQVATILHAFPMRKTVCLLRSISQLRDFQVAYFEISKHKIGVKVRVRLEIYTVFFNFGAQPERLARPPGGLKLQCIAITTLFIFSTRLLSLLHFFRSHFRFNAMSSHDQRWYPLNNESTCEILLRVSH